MINFIINRHGWPSEFTRGVQMAEFLGCKLNAPVSPSDVNIFIKCVPTADMDSKLPYYYMDTIDSQNTVDIAKMYPKATMISLTDMMAEYIANRCSNKTVVIPEHTCNFENVIRCREHVDTVGYVGSPLCFNLSVDSVQKALSAVGLKFVVLPVEHGVTREQVCDFYKSIDIQVAFRLDKYDVRPPVFRNPLKIINAGSFNIPTVAFPELAYRTYAKTCYLDAVDIVDLVNCCRLLRDYPDLYGFYASRSFKFSNSYTIDKIADLYRRLV